MYIHALRCKHALCLSGGFAALSTLLLLVMTWTKVRQHKATILGKQTDRARGVFWVTQGILQTAVQHTANE